MWAPHHIHRSYTQHSLTSDVCAQVARSASRSSSVNIMLPSLPPSPAPGGDVNAYARTLLSSKTPRTKGGLSYILPIPEGLEITHLGRAHELNPSLTAHYAQGWKQNERERGRDWPEDLAHKDAIRVWCGIY